MPVGQEAQGFRASDINPQNRGFPHRASAESKCGGRHNQRGDGRGDSLVFPNTRKTLCQRGWLGVMERNMSDGPARPKRLRSSRRRYHGFVQDYKRGKLDDSEENSQEPKQNGEATEAK